MLVAEFMRFYSGHTLGDVLAMPASAFFSLSNAMFMVQSDERLARIQDVAVPHMERSDADRIISELQRASGGVDKIIEQARVVKNGD